MDFVKNQNGPFFMHIHLMSTHCCSYILGDLPGLGRGKKLDSSARRDVLIRHSDAQFKRFYDFLDTQGLLENSIIIITSDHSERWNSTVRVPLLIRFPDGKKVGLVGRVEKNVSFIDLPPTILETIGLPVPDWMQGKSLLDTNRPSSEDSVSNPIITVPRFSYEIFRIGNSHLSQMKHPGPPIYGFKEVSMIACDTWKTLDLNSGKLKTGHIQHSNQGDYQQCNPVKFADDGEAKEYLIEYLSTEGFGVKHP